MRSTLWKGVGFGLTSGVITTLGVIVGLQAGTHSRLAVLAGILVIAIADALSDAMGIHVSEEAEMEHSTKEQWEAALFTFVSKFIFTLSFIIPVTLFEEYTSVIASVIWGLVLITIFSFHMARVQGQNPVKVVLEHVTITMIVVFLTHYIGEMMYTLWSV